MTSPWLREATQARTRDRRRGAYMKRTRTRTRRAFLDREPWVRQHRLSRASSGHRRRFFRSCPGGGAKDQVRSRRPVRALAAASQTLSAAALLAVKTLKQNGGGAARTREAPSSCGTRFSAVERTSSVDRVRVRDFAASGVQSLLPGGCCQGFPPYPGPCSAVRPAHCLRTIYF